MNHKDLPPQDPLPGVTLYGGLHGEDQSSSLRPEVNKRVKGFQELQYRKGRETVS